MHFRVLIICVIAIYGCGVAPKSNQEILKKDRMVSFSPHVRVGFESGDKKCFIDRKVQQIVCFAGDPVKWTNSYDVKLSEKNALLFADANGNFFIDINQNEILIHRGDFDHYSPLLQDPEGAIRAAAFEPASRTLMVWDGRYANLIRLSELGTVEQRVTVGAEIETGHTVIAGTILSDARIILAAKDRIYTVNISQTLAKNAWSYTAFSLDGGANSGSRAVRRIVQMAPAHTRFANHVLANDDDRLILIDLNSQKIVSEMFVASRNSRLFADRGYPHFVTTILGSANDEANVPVGYQVTYVAASGSLSSQTFADASPNLFDSYLDPDLQYWVEANKVHFDENKSPPDDDLVGSDAFQGTVNRFTMDDALFSEQTELREPNYLLIEAHKYWQLFSSALGRLRWSHYGSSPAYQDVANFNVSTLRRRHAK